MQVIRVFSQEDIELLKNTPLPPSPCTDCWSQHDGSCCGCDKEREHRKAIQPYKDNNIYEIACDITRAKNLKAQIKKCEDEIKGIEDNLPDAVKCLL